MPFRKIQTDTWDDSRFVALSLEARYLFLYLVTNPMVQPGGMFETTPWRIHKDTLIPEEQIPVLLREMGEMVHWDQRRGMFYIRNWMRHQCQNRSFLDAGMTYVFKKFPEYFDFFVDDNLDVIQRFANPAGYLAKKLNSPHSIKDLFQSFTETLNPPRSTTPVTSVSFSDKENLYINNSKDHTISSFREKENRDLAASLEDEVLAVVASATSWGSAAENGSNRPQIDFRGGSVPEGRVVGQNPATGNGASPAAPEPDYSRLKFPEETKMAAERCSNGRAGFVRMVALMEREYAEFPSALRHALIQFAGSPKPYAAGYFAKLCRDITSDYLSGRLKILDYKPKEAVADDKKYAGPRNRADYFRKQGWNRDAIIQKVFAGWDTAEIKICCPWLFE